MGRETIIECDGLIEVNKYGAVDVKEFMKILNRIELIYDKMHELHSKISGRWQGTDWMTRANKGKVIDLELELKKLKDLLKQELKINPDDYEYKTETKLIKKKDKK